MTKKGKFLQKINQAFANNDFDYVLENVTDDIHWTIVGDEEIKGKEEFAKALQEMAAEKPLDLTIHNIITHGDSASVDGTMTSAEGKTYAFCNVYKFHGFKNPRIKQMTSYVILINE